MATAGLGLLNEAFNGRGRERQMANSYGTRFDQVRDATKPPGPSADQPAPAPASSVADLDTNIELQEMKSRLNYVEREMTAAKADISATRLEITTVRDEIKSTNSRLDGLAATQDKTLSVLERMSGKLDRVCVIA